MNFDMTAPVSDDSGLSRFRKDAADKEIPAAAQPARAAQRVRRRSIENKAVIARKMNRLCAVVNKTRAPRDSACAGRRKAVRIG
jgi:hypothetical protein